MDGTQFLWLPWFPEKSGGYKIMRHTVQCYLLWVSVYFQRRENLWIGSVIVWLKWLFFVLAVSSTAWQITLVSRQRLWREFLNEESGNSPLLYHIQGCYDQTGDPTLFHWEHRKSSPEYCYRSLLWLLQEWQWSENQLIGTYTPFIHFKKNKRGGWGAYVCGTYLIMDIF